MSNYCPKQVYLLLILCAARAETRCDSQGMKVLFDNLSENFTDSKAGSATSKYLQNLLASARNGGKISLSAQRADVLGIYAGFRSYDEFASCYRDLSLWRGLHTPGLTVLGDQKTLSDLIERTEVLINSLPASPEFQPYHVCPDPKDLKAPVVIAINSETIPDFLSGIDLEKIKRDGHLVYWHQYEADDEFEANLPLGSQTITYEAKLSVLIGLASHPGLMGETDANPSGPGFQGTVHGTVFQGGVSISQNNHSTGQQFVTSSDVHITNNHHHNN